MKVIFCESGMQFFDEQRYYYEHGYKVKEISVDYYGDFNCHCFSDSEHVLIVLCDDKENEDRYIE